jgi:hypothetical protein
LSPLPRLWAARRFCAACPTARPGFAVGNAGAAPTPFRGGSGGGGGGGDGTNSGGGGGGGGGVVLDQRQGDRLDGHRAANGGAGFTPTTGNCGGGGGGGGGLIIVNTAGVTGGSSPTMTVTGGAAGPGSAPAPRAAPAPRVAVLNVFA